MDRILAEDSPGEQRVALLRAGVLTEYYVHRPGAPDDLGALHWARVTARVPAMAGAFLALAEAEAFLPDTEAPVPVTEGTYLVVRITRAGQGGKGPRVSAKLALEEAALATGGAPRLLRRGPTPLEELAAAYPGAAMEHGAFPDALAAEIEALGRPLLTLPGGMGGSVVATPALTAIDVDGGRATAARGEKDRQQQAANRAALPELARQIALRNLSGAILLDLAGMAAKRRGALGPALAQALAADRLAPRLLGFTALGFAEILRPRRRPPLAEQLRGPHAAGLAALRAVAAESAAAPARRLALRAAPAVIARLQADAASLAALAHITTHPLVLRSDPALRETDWLIEDASA
jgi:Ribonuclease G/E